MCVVEMKCFRMVIDYSVSVQSLKHVEKAIYSAKIPHVAPQRLDARTIKIPMPKCVNFALCKARSLHLRCV